MAGKIGLAAIRALGPNSEIFDQGAGAVAAFGARRRGGPSVSYFVMFRTADGKQRRLTIGRHGAPWTPDLARDQAKKILGEVVQGRDPAGEKRDRREALTIAGLCDRYLAEAAAGRILGRGGLAKKASTLEIDRGRVAVHIKPALGDRTAASVTRDDVNRLMHDIAAGSTGEPRKSTGRGVKTARGGRVAATRVVGLLGGIFAFAIEQGLRPDNPVHGVKKFADRKRERRLTDAEFAALGDGLRKAEAAGIWPAAVACTRMIALSGWRRGEALGLHWRDLDLDRRTVILTETKTGRSLRPLARGVCDQLRAMPRFGDGLGLVFPSSRGDGGMEGYFKYWLRVAKLSGLPADVTPHILRHSFASIASDLGYSEPTVAALVGHQGRSMTARYTHAADAVLLAAADAVARRIAELMGEAPASATVVELRGVA